MDRQQLLKREREKAASLERRIQAIHEKISVEFSILDARQERVRRLFEIQQLRLKLRLLKDETVQFETQRVQTIELIPELRKTRSTLIYKIVAAAKSVRKESCGIYFLTKDSRVVYVGQSKNVHQRLEAHLKSKEFDGACFVKCREHELSSLETAYIEILRPELNMDTTSQRLRAIDPIDPTG